ncbi:uncharacterized protein LACBIDRAFT_302799 [Laccaria bicolor S238N-H82]|uniref:Predicted protein n=1 Tax=Laccaria bicolor (strain S238N-H82 / ATCC MYA-4686) TaxID=486041 RepID=B0DIC0_LACBS|nr:uncharacterized protein LACBIDRAFT_302799 [Laccaria bicolor S238N-H82]EDR05662.1 predicted protein [Laccaria bicolor S238N-H82]|eukprot:XP_001883766.1 predicted protein [Laccaria bicolor S238N-H82]
MKDEVNRGVEDSEDGEDEEDVEGRGEAVCGFGGFELVGDSDCSVLCRNFIIDIWQYFLHRFMHADIKQFHSWRHRLYVPYAFGSLYNYQLEGFLLDTLGAVIAEWAMGLSTRQAMPLFSVSSLKTVDDQYGYNFRGTRYRCLR